MSDILNFFQAVFIFKNFEPAQVAKPEVRLAVELKKEAQILESVAKTEVKNGHAAQELAAQTTDENKVRIFTEIAVWHNNRAADKYRKAAARFDEAGKVYTKKSKAFVAKANEMTNCAAETEATVGYLTDFLKRNR